MSQIFLNFGSPAPLDVQIAGNDLNASRAFAHKLLAQIRHVPGIADPRIQEAFQDPALKVDFNREFAGVVGLTENDASTALQTTPQAAHKLPRPIGWAPMASPTPFRSKPRNMALIRLEIRNTCR